MSETPDPRLTRRDAGLRRVRTARRWMAGGAVVLTGAFAGLAARGTHATTTTASSSAGTSSGSSSSSSSSGAQSQSQSDGGATLQAPASPPQSSTSGPQASSGAS